VKLHRGPLKSHPEQRAHGNGMSLHEIIRTDPATYTTHQKLYCERPTPEQEREAVLACRDRLLELVERVGDSVQPNTARAWMVQHHDKKPLWFVHVLVLGTRKWDDVKEKVDG
jgi:hypothetical protein